MPSLFWYNWSSSLFYKYPLPSSPNWNINWASAWINAFWIAILIDLSKWLFPLTLKGLLFLGHQQLVTSNKNHANLYFTCRSITCMIPTKRVRVLAINILAASLAPLSIMVAFDIVPLLLGMRNFSSGARLRTTDPTIKLTTGKGPGRESLYQLKIINHKCLGSTCHIYIGLERCVR